MGSSRWQARGATKSTHADRLLARLSGDGLPDVLTTKDVGDQLRIKTFSFPLSASWTALPRIRYRLGRRRRA
jgi:hypothetical protein